MSEKDAQSETDRDIRGSNKVDPEKIAAYREAMRAIADKAGADEDPLEGGGIQTVEDPRTSPDKTKDDRTELTDAERAAAKRGAQAALAELEAAKKRRDQQT